MLSILIPTYNYIVYPLVLELHKQSENLGIVYEILVQDDGSSNFLNENQIINDLTNCSYIINDKNYGRTFTRGILANKASFEWILFLDADVIPVNSNFISSYITLLDSKNRVILGGYSYKKTKPDSGKEFRYKYGKKREEKKAVERNLTPYQFVFSGNILIKKKIFLTTNYAGENSFYGMDIFFAYQLFVKKVEVHHIDNPIYHLGLETNQIFFEKSLKAVESRKKFVIDCNQIEKISPLIKHYKTIKKYCLLPLIIVFFRILQPILKKLILNKNPSLICFDLYRLGYLCTLK
jgi:glycosyltransferase involved in cell wall biosynthesis